MARSPTIKPTETEFHIKDSYFNFIDVGGQKWLRAAWAQFFDNVQAIIFVGSAGGFDQIINNGDSENRLSDSMKLFELTVNNPLLNTIDVILFLNKSDLLEDKIKRISFKKYVPQFTGKTVDSM